MWAKETYEKQEEQYKEVFDSSVLKARAEFDLAFKELLIRSKIMKHDFTKRQMNILTLILTLSFQCGKDEALIPKLQDFELAGISKTKIKQELKMMEEMKVIIWDKDVAIFKINDPRKWNVPYNSGFNYSRLNDLFKINLKYTGKDVDPVLSMLTEDGF